MHHYIHIMMAMISFFLLLSLTSLASPFPAPPNQPPQVITSPHGAVAADDARCSAAGRDALLHGGSAVDAAVTVALCLGVVSPASSGLGGGAFMLLHLQSTGDAWAFDMRETAPLSSSQHMFENNTASKSSGPLSIAVPGELAGLYKAWKSYGKLPWPQLVAPAINLAQNGFQVSRYLRVQMESAINGILSDEGLRQVFTINGTLLKVGDICYNKRLAKTLTNIAKQGPSVFYSGSVGAQLVADVKKGGGILSMEDLRRYKVKVTRPLSADVIGLKFLGMPPPSAGGAGLILVRFSS